MASNTPNYDLYKKNPATDGADTFNIESMLNENWDKVDTALTPTANPSLTPAGNGPFKLVTWVGYLVNRLKTITGKANWYDSPTKSMEQLATDATAHLAAADPHTQYALDTDLSSLAGAGRTTETVKGNADALAIHQADYTHNAGKIYAYKNFGGAL